MNVELGRTDADMEHLDDDCTNSEDSNGVHNVHSAEVNVDAFWQNPYALSMVSSNAVALRDVKPDLAIGAAIDEEADPDADGDEEPDGSDPTVCDVPPAASSTTTPSRRRKYGSHLCPVCGRSFGQKMVMYEHLNLHYGVRPHFCAVCGIRFASCSNLIKHRQLHRKHFSCVLCGDQSPTLNTFSDVQNHVMTVHPDVFAYRCTVCHSKFETQGLLADHVIMHPPLVLETRLEGKDKRKRNKPMVQFNSAKRSGPALRSGLRSDNSNSNGNNSNSNSNSNSNNNSHVQAQPKATQKSVIIIGAPLAQNQNAVTGSGNANELNARSRATLPNPNAAAGFHVCNGDREHQSAQNDAAHVHVQSFSARPDANCATAGGQVETNGVGERGKSPASPAVRDEDKLFETLLQKRIVNGEMFRCSICDILFFDRAMFSVHRCTHEENNPLRCAMCRTQCSDRYEFALHCVKPKQQDAKAE